ncbi:MAG: sulfotransferase [Gammaproteobacteria bacterium]
MNQPNLPQEKSDKVLLLLRAGRLPEAKQAALELVQTFADNPATHLLLANVIRASGNDALPHFRKAAELAPDDVSILGAYANAAAANDLYAEAALCYGKIIDLQPENAAAHSNLGVLFRQQGKNDQAAHAFRKALKINPGFSIAHENLSSVLIEMHSYEAAERAAKKALKASPGNPNIHKNLGIALLKQELTDEALEHFNIAKEGGVTDKDLNYGIALTYAAAGDFDKAKEAFKHAVVENPTDMSMLHDFAHMIKSKRGDDVWNMLNEAYKNKDRLDEENQIRLNFALGKVNNDADEYDAAFEYYAAGNSMRFEIEKPDLTLDRLRVRKIKKIFADNDFSSIANNAHDHVKPIFVIGMPRSGTTLVEQIIASHSEVSALGEFLGIPRVVMEQEHIMNTPYPEIMHSVTNAHLEDLAKRYVNRVETRINDKTIFTDKQLSGYLYIGIMRVMFPAARFIVCKRNPLDNCVSCFFTDFSDKGFYSNDLKQLGEYHRLNSEMLDFWLTRFPEQVMEVVYEDVIEDLEKSARRMIDFCQLPWDDACLRFNEMQRGVLNASMTQVRQKIYTRSVQRWRKYEKHLGPLFEGLQLDPEKT